MMNFVYEFKRREPVFQHPEFGRTRQDFEKLTGRDFYEIDALGQRHSREQAINIATDLYKNSNYRGIYSWPEGSWEIRELEWHKITHNLFLVTYILDRESKVTYRTSIWQQSQSEWKITFHQATSVNSKDEINNS